MEERRAHALRRADLPPPLALPEGGLALAAAASSDARLARSGSVSVTRADRKRVFLSFCNKKWPRELGRGPPQAAWRGAVVHPSGGPSAPGRRCWRLRRKRPSVEYMSDPPRGTRVAPDSGLFCLGHVATPRLLGASGCQFDSGEDRTINTSPSPGGCSLARNPTPLWPAGCASLAPRPWM